MRRIGIFLSIAAILLTPLFVQAQSLSIDLSIDMIPLDPKPLSPVRLEAKSFSIDLNQATLVWRYGNRTIASGVGKTQLSVTTPASGGVGLVSVTASGIGFEPTTASIGLRPASVDVLWEAADSYTPPFYKGKALPATNALLRMTAIPTSTAPRQLGYQWSRNGSAQPTNSGANKQSFLLKNSELNRSETVAVDVSGGSFTGNGNATITMRSPSLIAYQKYEGFIDYANGSTTEVVTNQPGMILRFEPYYFSFNTRIENDLAFDIDVDGISLIGDPVINELRLSRPDEGGFSRINLGVTTVAYSLQNLKRLFTVYFN